MKKFLTAVMSLLLVGLTCILIYVAVNQGSFNLNWNKDWDKLLFSSTAPTEVSAPSTPPRSQGTTVQEKVPDDNEGGSTLSVSKTIAPSSKNYAFLPQHSGVDCLTDSGSRALYDQMLKTAYTVTSKPDKEGYYATGPITVSKQKITENQIRMAVLAFRNDHPQVFWIANRYSYSTNGFSTTVKLYSYIPASQCNTLVKKLNSSITKIVGAMPAGLSELNREVYIFKIIAQKCIYDDAAVTDTTLWLPHTAVGGLVDGKAVCEGYARAMQVLSSYCGLESQTVNGDGNGAAHMWNLMKIDGSWYQFDPTWIDGTMINYDYFNVTDDIIRVDHTISADISSLSEEQVKSDDNKPADYNLTLPPCDAVKANYYVAKGIHIADFESENNNTVISAIVAAAKVKSSVVVFYIEESLDYKQTVSQMLKTSPYQLSYFIKKANQALGGSVVISENNIRYTESENNRGITVMLSYQ